MAVVVAIDAGTTGVRSRVIGADGTIYVGSNDNTLYAISGKTGRKKWGFVTGDRVYSSPALGTDGTVYVGSADQNIYAIKPDGTGPAR